MKIILPFIMSNLLGANFDNVSNGFGLDIGSRGSGVFLIRQYLDNEKPIGLNLELRFYDVKGENETVFYDYYTGTYQSISGKSLFLSPLFVGLNYYPFKDKIENNFLPFLTSRAGLVFILDGNDSGSFLRDGQILLSKFHQVAILVVVLISNMSQIHMFLHQ